MPATALAYLLAGWAIPALLGPGYVAAVLPARVLLLSIPFIAASYPIVSRLQAEGRAGATTVMFIVGAIAGIGGIIVLTPRMGVLGACLAATLREPLILATGIVMLRRSGGREAHPTGADPGAVPDD